MTQKDKELLLKDLCARLPYGVICNNPEGDGHLCSINQTIFGTNYGININPTKRDHFNDSENEEQIIKPYLRPMSSMTEEEKVVINDLVYNKENSFLSPIPIWVINESDIETYIDFCHEHHLDWRRLIEKGLAFEAPEGMYKTE